MIRRLHDLGVTSDMAYAASFGSIILSYIIWYVNRRDKPHAERFGIYVGLWAPMLAVLARGLEETERRLGLQQ